MLLEMLNAWMAVQVPTTFPNDQVSIAASSFSITKVEDGVDQTISATPLKAATREASLIWVHLRTILKLLISQKLECPLPRRFKLGLVLLLISSRVSSIYHLH